MPFRPWLDVRIIELQSGGNNFTATYVPASGHAVLDDTSALSYQTDLIASD